MRLPDVTARRASRAETMLGHREGPFGDPRLHCSTAPTAIVTGAAPKETTALRGTERHRARAHDGSRIPSRPRGPPGRRGRPRARLPRLRARADRRLRRRRRLLRPLGVPDHRAPAARARRTGTISLPGFYARRARRLLPASALVLLVTAIASALVLPPLRVPRRRGRRGVGRAVRREHPLRAAGHRLPRRPSWPPSPLLHFWSLGVEEQFYLVWPALAAGRSSRLQPGPRGDRPLRRAGRRR